MNVMLSFTRTGRFQVFRSAVAKRLVGPVDLLLRYRPMVKFLLQVGIIILANYFSYLVRFDFSIPSQYLLIMRETVPVLLAAKAVGFIAFGLFIGWWRYISIRDILPIASGCTMGSLLYAGAVSYFYGPAYVPRSIYFLDWGSTILLVLGIRYMVRAGREMFGRIGKRSERRVLIVGAGAAGRMLAREIRENAALGMVEVGFIDDDPRKIGTRIEGLRVLGNHDRIEEIARDYDVDEIIIAIPSARPSHIRHIVEHCRSVSARSRILPGVGELIGGTLTVKSLRDVNLEDLLGRDPVTLDTELLRRDITEHVVMVTGAAGSIGSELCRQLAGLAPAKLVMFEIAETPLFELENDMREKFPNIPLVSVIGDIRDRKRVEEVFAAHSPTLVYHAAAYKHVPVMEVQPGEAVKTNVLGTRILADAAARHGVQRFVLVSTDKAVRPTNVMGATKRVAELLIQNMNGSAKGTIFIAVRFGNVLDSTGSVIPIFRKQLETTGKLTVTHIDASRYFMLIPEAAALILQAGAMGEGGEVFVLDMGEPVKIIDLAKNLIRLSGRELGVNAEIVFTGLRPGEKLHEELVIEGEDVTRTTHAKVMKLIGDGKMPKDWSLRLERLIELARQGDRVGIVRELDSLIKGYHPDYSFHGIHVAGDSPGFPAFRRPSSSPADANTVADEPPPASPPSKTIH
jgi:FlaA1/EpsC-like NDP-sugar epimerase